VPGNVAESTVNAPDTIKFAIPEPVDTVSTVDKLNKLVKSIAELNLFS
jgi:hypothetical protein